VTPAAITLDQKEVSVLLENETRFLGRNYPMAVAGRGSNVFNLPGQQPLAVLNLQGASYGLRSKIPSPRAN